MKKRLILFFLAYKKDKIEQKLILWDLGMKEWLEISIQDSSSKEDLRCKDCFDNYMTSP